VTVCATRTYGAPFEDGFAYGTVRVPVSLEPTVVVLPDSQYVTINPLGACVDAAFFGAFRAFPVRDGEVVDAPVAPVWIQLSLNIDGEGLSELPDSAPMATLAPGSWTTAGTRVVGKARPVGGSPKENRLFGMGVHLYSVVVVVDTTAYAGLEEPRPDHVELQFKGALTVNTTV
jgi:hypothetical protein